MALCTVIQTLCTPIEPLQFRCWWWSRAWWLSWCCWMLWAAFAEGPMRSMLCAGSSARAPQVTLPPPPSPPNHRVHVLQQSVATSLVVNCGWVCCVALLLLRLSSMIHAHAKSRQTTQPLQPYTQYRVCCNKGSHRAVVFTDLVTHTELPMHLLVVTTVQVLDAGCDNICTCEPRYSTPVLGHICLEICHDCHRKQLACAGEHWYYC